MMKHKWHKEIKAWADGAEIEIYYDAPFHNWCPIPSVPEWKENQEYRIKPQPVEPQYLYAYYMGSEIKWVKGGQIVEGKSAIYLGKIPLIVESDDA